VTKLLGVTLPGPLDSAGYLVPLDSSGLPRTPLTVLFEVKNLRSWIYPSAPEVYQLLHKAVVLQTAHPDHPIVPVFVCRMAHETTFYLAKQLGFMTIAMGIQFAGDIGEEELLEVRNELHFQDLARGRGPSLRVRDRLTETLPRTGPAIAEQWAMTVSDPSATDLITRLRRSTRHDRDELMTELRRVNGLMGRRGGW
jgi:hypothetical protein